MHGSRSRFREVLPLLLGLLAVPAKAAAQAGTDTAIDANPLWLAAGPSHFVTLRSTALAADGETFTGAFTSFQHNPIVLRNGSREHPAVGELIDLDLLVAIGLFDRLQLGAAVPLTLVQTGVGTTPITDAGEPRDTVRVLMLRDLRFALDWRPVAREDAASGLGLLLSAGITAPMGEDRAFAGQGRVTFVPALVADYRAGAWLVGVDLSARLRTVTRALGAARFASEAVARAGVSWLASDLVSVSLEGSGDFQLAPQPEEASVHPHGYELGLGVRWSPLGPAGYCWRAAFALGAGGLGAPGFRILIGASDGASPWAREPS